MRTLTLDPETLRVDTFVTSDTESAWVGPTTRTNEPGCTSPTMCNPTVC